MALTRIATARGRRSADTVLAVDVAGQHVRLTKADLTTHNTAAKLRTETARQLGRAAPEFFFHFNRDGSIALAVGDEPEVWPEDEVE